MSHPNYITPAGARRLSEELNHLLRHERPKTVDEVATAAAHGDRSDNAEYKYGKARLREIDRRIRFLQRRLDSVEVVDPATQQADAVFFGAEVDVEDEEGRARTYQLVGEDESAPDRGRVSWRSPIGRALLRKRVGDVVTVERPSGTIELEVVAIRYGAGRRPE
ncbi:MAG: transcription elongation factor GreB [Deltaproteobacteria bacterium]|jgi:transcription elongation factor GreB|nr:transcription elongation factor GreB [Deltaproteobacteria bacterium]MBW2531894.1 transcription elongation factor GreB [Deltaproteobacteria bacterium]